METSTQPAAEEQPPAASFRQRFFTAMANVSPLVIVFALCVVCSLLTFVIPGGTFERRTIDVMGHARSIVVPGSFHRVPSVPQGFLELWTVFMRGAIEAADRSFVILLSAGAMTAVTATGAIDAGIHLLVRRTGRLWHRLHPGHRVRARHGEGMRSVVIAVIMMSAAQIIYFILHDALILDTVLNFFGGYLERVPQFVVAYVMFGTSAVMAALLGSASGTAATVMPVLAPLADVLHFSK